MSQEREKHPVFDGFVTNWVFNPTKNNILDHYELQVYSALAHAQGRGQKPSILALAWRTGINRDTVSRRLASLESKQFLAQGEAVPRPDAFFEIKNAPKSEHWSRRLRFWKCLVRSESSPVKVSDQAVLSYLWWSKTELPKKKAFSPKHGWSVKYLASVLAIKPETVRQACERLEERQLLTRTADAWLTPSALAPWQENWFKRKSSVARINVNSGDFIPDMAKLPQKFWPGETVWADDEDDSPVGMLEELATPFDGSVDWIRVRTFCEGVLASHGGINDASAVIRSVKSEIERLGTTTNDWRRVITEAVAKQLAKPKVPPRPARSKTETDEQNFLREFEAMRA